MTEAAATNSRPPAHHPSLIGQIIALPFHLFGVLVGSLLLSILIECVGMHWFWKDQGWHHSQEMLQYELTNLSEHFARSVIVSEPEHAAQQLADTAYQWVFVKTGLLHNTNGMAVNAQAASQSRNQDLRHYVGQAYVWAGSYLIAAAFTTLTFLVRLLVLVLTLPLFIMAAFVGVVDGLVRRDVRRFGAGRESGFLYHRAKAALAPLAMLPWVVYLALPVSLNPLFILLPSAALLGLVVNLTVGSFKKYL
jgi:integrating conjugative element membrane protein (TIGR03747 family)